MRAWVLRQIDQIQLETVEDPTPAPGEVTVAVKAVGICGSDIPRIYQTGAYDYPLIPGHEFSGVVVGLGPGTDRTWLGRRVGVFPLLPCKTCEPCRKGLFEMCRRYSYIGSRRNGAFAELVTAPAGNLLALPDNVSFEEAAMLEPMAVAVHAMRRAAPRPRDTVAVCGLGTIGLLLTMLLLDAGIAHIHVWGNKDFQKVAVQKVGLSASFYHSNGMDEGQPLPDLGADVLFECVGKNETLAQTIAGAAPGGKVVLVGNPAAPQMAMNRSIYWKILRNQLTVLGTWNSSFTHHADDDWHYILDRLTQGFIRPTEIISHRFPLTDLDKGLRIMRDKTAPYGKIMGLW